MIRPITERTPAVDLWNISGDFGRVEGAVTRTQDGYAAEGQGYAVASHLESGVCGVVSRRDTFRNIGDAPVTLSSFSTRYVFDGGEYEVYTQYCGWQNESLGGWQELITTVAAEGVKSRLAEGASPFLVLWDKQAGRGTAFHLLPWGLWQMRVSCRHDDGIHTNVTVELGIHPDSLRMTLAPGESAELPEVLTYPVLDRTELDAWRLHRYWNRRAPRRELPIVYNTWMTRFDHIDFENVTNQIDRAVRLGVEYFVIDAGWFGKGDGWWECVGDWEENETKRLAGSMAEISRRVREAGMKFGFWLEIGRADVKAEASVRHPEYYFFDEGNYFVNFADPAARRYLVDTVRALVEKYSASFLKFDDNADCHFDHTGDAYQKYMRGQELFFRDLRAACPHVYFENCASGGGRLALRDSECMDSFWPSDDQSPKDGIRLFRDTVRRMPPQLIEKWATVCSMKGKTPLYADDKDDERIIAAHDCTWVDLIGVRESYLHAFLTGGSPCFTCDLNGISDETFEGLCRFTAAFRRDRAFWLAAECRVLADTESVTAFQFTDEAFSDIRLVSITEKMRQRAVTLFPHVAPGAVYETEQGVRLSAEEIERDGIRLPCAGSYMAEFFRLRKVEK